MKFFIPDKIVLNIENPNGEYYFSDIKKYRDYVINFSCENLVSKKLKLQFTQYFSHGNKVSNTLSLNCNYVCSSYYLEKISFKIIGDYNINTDLINLNLIETPTNLDEIPITLPSKLVNFIEYVKNNHINCNEKTYPEVKLATILDDFSFKSFQNEINIINLNYENCLDELKSFMPNIFFIESAWNGANNSWEGKIRNNTNCIDDKLLSLVRFCNQNNIPTIFWNKEDLANLKFFKNCSSIFDYIFVTDENLIPYHIKSCNHEHVNILEFAAQPKIHNSVNKNKFKLGSLAFAGAWYGNKYSNRNSDCDVILKPSLDFKLDIFDRNYQNKNKLSYFDMYWPREFHKNIIGSLPYEYIVEAYKNYDLFLNVNSIKNSNTMVSRRIYEILACKTPVLSSVSDAIEDKFKSYVYTSNDKNFTKTILNKILNNNFESRKTAKKAQRFILDNHTYKHRIEQVFDTINFKYTKKTNPKIGIIGILNEEEDINLLNKNILCQSYTNFDVHILVNKNINLKDTVFDKASVSIYYCELSDKEKTNKILNQISLFSDIYDYFVIFNSNIFYAENYIKDYINTLQFVNADIIGKNHILADFKNNKEIYEKCDEHMDSYCNSVFSCSLFINSNKFIDFIKHVNLIESEILYNFNKFTMYSDDEFNISKSNRLFNLINV